MQDADNEEVSNKTGEETKEAEEMMEMPFGILGISILCNITQYAAFLGFTVLIIMLITIFRPE